MEKLSILADSAKYDVACTSSGVDRGGAPGALGSCHAPGICHTFTADGRCVSLLKVLMTNICAYDCRYCTNRRSEDRPRAAFTPEELAELTIQFYRRNYIEGLFLSSAVLVSPDYTMERMIRVLETAAGGISVPGLYPRQDHPGGGPGAGAPDGPAGRPAEREHRTAQRGQPETAGPGQAENRHPAADGADRPHRRREPPGTDRLPARPPPLPLPGKAPR